MHEEMMRRAVLLAARGRGHTAPNPLVGAVLVRDGEILGEGWHAVYGGLHEPRSRTVSAAGTLPKTRFST